MSNNLKKSSDNKNQKIKFDLMLNQAKEKIEKLFQRNTSKDYKFQRKSQDENSINDSLESIKNVGIYKLSQQNKRHQQKPRNQSESQPIYICQIQKLQQQYEQLQITQQQMIKINQDYHRKQNQETNNQNDPKRHFSELKQYIQQQPIKRQINTTESIDIIDIFKKQSDIHKIVQNQKIGMRNDTNPSRQKNKFITNSFYKDKSNKSINESYDGMRVNLSPSNDFSEKSFLNSSSTQNFYSKLPIYADQQFKIKTKNNQLSKILPQQNNFTENDKIKINESLSKQKLIKLKNPSLQYRIISPKLKLNTQNPSPSTQKEKKQDLSFNIIQSQSPKLYQSIKNNILKKNFQQPANQSQFPQNTISPSKNVNSQSYSKLKFKMQQLV